MEFEVWDVHTVKGTFLKRIHYFGHLQNYLKGIDINIVKINKKTINL